MSPEPAATEALLDGGALAVPLALRIPPPLMTREPGLFLVAQANPIEMGVVSQRPVFPPAEPDWAGLGRDTAYLLGYQALGFLVLYVSPEAISNWSSEDKKHYDFSKWSRNVSHPTMDEDKWWINYVLHPYWGSAYYLDARGRGFSRWGAFCFSVTASNLYEFGTEAFAEKPSIQDIFVTPIAGSLLGMVLESTWRELVLKGESRNWGDSVLLYLIDPLGQLNHAVDRGFGFESPRTAVDFRPVIRPVPGHGTYAGIQMNLRW